MNVSNIRSFIPIQKLGEGSFASVYKVKRISDQKIYALKKIKMNKLPQKAKENSLNQVRFLASFDSPYITKYYEAFFDQNLDVLCIVMEYAESGDLRKMINRYQKQKQLITQIQIWKVMIHLLYGLQILHDNKILHRDIKCENILVSNSKYKIGDMNVSKVNKQGFADTQTGTPYYASPEVWKDEPYNQKSDIWSLGCIIYEMATLRPPFMGAGMQDLYKNILKGKYLPIPKCYSNQLSSIIKQCLKMNPFERPSTLELLGNKSLKIYENICMENRDQKIKMNVSMLQTINLPKNMKELNKCLPKSNYETIIEDDQLLQAKKGQHQIKKQVKQEIIQIKTTQNQNIKEQDKTQKIKEEELKINHLNKKSNHGNNYAKKTIQEIQKKQNTLNYLKMAQNVNNIERSLKKPRRILRQIQKQMVKKRSRSRSLPRTQRKSMSQSKELVTQSSKKQLHAVNLGKQNHQQILSVKKQGKNNYWNIISQAKQYLERGINKNRKIM